MVINPKIAWSKALNT